MPPMRCIQAQLFVSTYALHFPVGVPYPPHDSTKTPSACKWQKVLWSGRIVITAAAGSVAIRPVATIRLAARYPDCAGQGATSSGLVVEWILTFDGKLCVPIQV
jgi:hypothetical protein